MNLLVDASAIKLTKIIADTNDRIFPISYEAARIMVLRAGIMVGIHLRPHDLPRHAATYASRSGVPIEIISKIILRHANLSTTQLYLGKGGGPQKLDNVLSSESIQRKGTDYEQETQKLQSGI